MKKGIAVMLKNKKGKILFCLRDNKPSIVYPNFWAPLGGTVEKTEKPIQTAIREVKEEINYNIESILFIGTLRDEYENLVYVYVSRIDKEIDELTLNEGQKIEYFSFEKLLRIKIPRPLRKFIIKHKKEIMNY